MGRHSRNAARPRKRRFGPALVVAVVIGVLSIAAALIFMNATSQPAPSQPQTEPLPSVSGEPSAAVEATESPSAVEPEPEPVAVRRAAFDGTAALREVQAIEAFGVRKGGSTAERAAADHIAERLRSFGLTPGFQEFDVPGGTSRNVVARIEGSLDAIIVLGAHYDSKPPSPGANDNGTGCGALLQLAQVLASEGTTPTVEVVFFGSEEVLGTPDQHHYGSRRHVALMDTATRRSVAGMISIDMIGYGPDFHSRTMGRGPQMLSDMLLSKASAMGIPMTYLKDPGSTGWSDHEPYELAGIPAAWIEWRDDPLYHKTGDTSDRIVVEKVAAAGRLVLEFVRTLSEQEIDALLAR